MIEKQQEMLALDVKACWPSFNIQLSPLLQFTIRYGTIGEFRQGQPLITIEQSAYN